MDFLLRLLLNIMRMNLITKLICACIYIEYFQRLAFFGPASWLVTYAECIRCSRDADPSGTRESTTPNLQDLHYSSLIVSPRLIQCKPANVELRV